MKSVTPQKLPAILFADDLIEEMRQAADARGVLLKILGTGEWTQITLAKELNTDQSRVSKWLRAEKPGGEYRLRLIRFIERAFPFHIQGGSKKELGRIISSLSEASIKILLGTARALAETEVANRLQNPLPPAEHTAATGESRHKT